MTNFQNSADRDTQQEREEEGVTIEIDEDMDSIWLIYSSMAMDDEDELKFIKTNLDSANRTTATRKVAPSNIPRLPKGDEFQPRVISIGPYFRGKSELQPMEDHKRHYVGSILRRNPDRTLEDYFSKLKSLATDVEGCYGEFTRLSSAQFMEMMLLDGCFIVEYFLRIHCNVVDELNISNLMRQKIEYDILLMQNQLPFCIIQSIFDLVKDQNSEDSLSGIIVEHFGHSSLIQRTLFHHSAMPSLDLPESIDHLLHLYHLFLVSASHAQPTFGSRRGARNLNLSSPHALHTGMDEEVGLVSVIPSATVLKRAGITFKRGSNLSSVRFQNRTIEIPPIIVDEFTKILIRDLILFEKFNTKVNPEFTAFAKFLDNIIETSADVALLREKGIIDHSFRSDNEVASLFNDLGGSYLSYKPAYLKHVYKKVDDYCRGEGLWVSLMRFYFSKSLLILKSSAAVILVLTFVQTFTAVYSFVRQLRP